MAEKKTDRREFLKRSAALAGGLGLGAVTKTASAQLEGPEAFLHGTDEIVGYGKRSRFVNSKRIPHGGRASPDSFGLDFHIAAPLQDSVGVITPSSLHYMGTTRGSYIPDIDPAKHRLMIHGMVERPLVFTMEELKRLPSVTRMHFVECAGNRSNRRHTTVQETHGMTSNAEWTGVLLSTLLEEAGVLEGGEWIVAEGVEEVKGASTIPMTKAMDDCLLCYGMNGEPVRPQQGFPLRLLAPGFEGIFNVKWLRRIKVVDRYYMTYNDYGHLTQDPVTAALGYQIGPKSVITHPSGGQTLPGTGFYEVSGLAWSGGGKVARVEVSTNGGQSWFDAEIRGTAYPMAHTRFTFNWDWDGSPCELQSRCTDDIGQLQPSRAQASEFFNQTPGQPGFVRGQDNSIQPWRIESDGSVHNAIA
ncbi:MAG: molybdopterin-dependent oxidoreductase [Proteobacteria bacterium]|nr:molybdopterin-dependent oxidoreductase [Pseudomonadota bacterium]